MSGRIDKKELNELLMKSAKVRTDLKLDLYDNTVYHELNDKKILLDFPNADYGVVFDSETELIQFRKDIAKKNDEHVLHGVFQSEEDFYTTVQKSANRISAYLSIPIEKLDKSFISLKEVDTQLRDKAISFNFYIRNIYKYLICYIGEVIINSRKGKWQLKLDEEGIVEPFVLLETGKFVNVFIDLYSDAQEDWESFSVYATAHLRLDNLN
jgi:hypothetical protein